MNQQQQPAPGPTKPEPEQKAIVSLGQVSSVEHATALARHDPEAAGRMIFALLRSNTEMLPGTTFVRRSDDTLMKKIRVGVRLSLGRGELIEMPRMVRGEKLFDLEPSLEGLRTLNSVAALQVIRPEVVIVDGKQQMNPFIQVNPDTRMPEVVFARAIAAGYGPSGSLVATDAMVRLDVNIYLLEAIQSKMRGSPEKTKRIGRYGVATEKPEKEGDNDRRCWAFMPIHSVGAMGLWVAINEPEVQDTLREHTTRLKFIERLAQSFAERNALKAHPAIPRADQVDVDRGTAIISVTGWTTNFDRDDIDNLRRMIAADELHKFQTRSGDIIDVQVVNETPEDEEAKHAIVEQEAQALAAADPTRDRDSEDEDEAHAGGESIDLLEAATSRFASLVDLGSRALAKQVTEACGIAALDEASDDELRAFIEAADKQLDQE